MCLRGFMSKILVIDEISKTVTKFPVESGFTNFLVSGNSPNVTPPYSAVVLITKDDYNYSERNRLIDLQEAWGLQTKFYIFTQSITTEQSFYACKNFSVRLYSKTSVGTRKMYQDFTNEVENLKKDIYEKAYN